MIYEGDEINLLADGSFTTNGKINVKDGSIWINLVDGRLNLKKDQKAGTEEEMTEDYLMAFKDNNTA